MNVLILTGPLYMLQVYDRVLGSRSVPTLVALTVVLFGWMVTGKDKAEAIGEPGDEQPIGPTTSEPSSFVLASLVPWLLRPPPGQCRSQ